jgi:diguanylate cyclase (GGDEF)-like protein
MSNITTQLKNVMLFDIDSEYTGIKFVDHLKNTYQGDETEDGYPLNYILYGGKNGEYINSTHPDTLRFLELMGGENKTTGILNIVNDLKIQYFYILYKDSSDTFRFVFDTDPTYDPRNTLYSSEDTEYINDIYVTSDDTDNLNLYNTLNKGIVSKKFLTSTTKDDWGTHFTGILPLEYNGTTYLLCIDTLEPSVDKQLSNFLYMSLFLGVALLVTFVVSGIWINRLINNAKLLQERIQTMAYYDSLTKLPNRTKLMEYLREIIAGLTDDMVLSALFIDLDNFKKVNDNEGHLIGDLVLQEIAIFLQSSLEKGFVSRPGGGTQDFVARLGGDEFLVLYLSKNKQDVVDYAATLFTKMKDLKGDSRIINLYDVSLSIGIAYYDKEKMDSSALLANADFAMYKAKRAGKSRFHIYDDSTDQEEKEIVKKS